jgi:Icc-related predicted phosphoesterase/uncharacterized ParB-like nuclease family protein
LKILSVSDLELGSIYSPQVRSRFGDVDMVIACGDLPYYYLEYIISMLDKPLYYVRGNHASKEEFSSEGDRREPWGGIDLHRRVVRDSSGLLLAGIEGCVRYNRGAYQYTQPEMWSMVLLMVPALILNRIRYGRYLDIFVSHAPPWKIHDLEDPPHRGAKAFRWLVDVFKPAAHLHGHIHVYGSSVAVTSKRNETHIMNAYGYREFYLEMRPRAVPCIGKTLADLGKEVEMTGFDERKTSQIITRMAQSDYETALRKSFWRSLFSWVTQSDNRLLSYDEVRKVLPVAGQHYAGFKTISIDQVVGSVGRYQDFDRVFLPTQKKTSGRWISIDEAHLRSDDLPPIEVYKIGDTYFVKDGHHRVSVARERGQKFIDATVVEVDIPVPIDKDANIDDILRLREQADFLVKTGLKNLRPDSNVELTLPGGYEKLIHHIEVHRWFMGEERKAEVQWSDAVAGWYDDVYSPLVQVIGQEQLLKDFPRRSESDLYLWIIEHLWYLREEYKGDVSLETAATSFRQEFAQRPRRWLNRLRKWLPGKKTE